MSIAPDLPDWLEAVSPGGVQIIKTFQAALPAGQSFRTPVVATAPYNQIGYFYNQGNIARLLGYQVTFYSDAAGANPIAFGPLVNKQSVISSLGVFPVLGPYMDVTVTSNDIAGAANINVIMTGFTHGSAIRDVDLAQSLTCGPFSVTALGAGGQAILAPSSYIAGRAILFSRATQQWQVSINVLLGNGTYQSYSVSSGAAGATGQIEVPLPRDDWQLQVNNFGGAAMGGVFILVYFD